MAEGTCAIVKMQYPPSANRIWRNVNGRTLKSSDYRAWREAQEWQVRAQKEPTILGPYALHVMVVRPDNRRRDIDNLVKPISDVLTSAGIVEDDSLCQRLTIEWVSAVAIASPVKVFVTSTGAQ